MSVPHQKHVIVHKEPCDGEKREHFYAAINLIAMEQAAQNLDAGAFKLWCYMAKNRNNWDFDLSSKAVEETFGIKIKQYNNAVKELIDKKYLVNTKGNNYVFNEISLITKGNNAVITKEDNDVITKSNKALLLKETRNITPTTFNTTNNTVDSDTSPKEEEEEEGSNNNPILVSKEWLMEKYNLVQPCANGLYYYNDKFYKEEIV